MAALNHVSGSRSEYGCAMFLWSAWQARFHNYNSKYYNALSTTALQCLKCFKL